MKLRTSAAVFAAAALMSGAAFAQQIGVSGEKYGFASAHGTDRMASAQTERQPAPRTGLALDGVLYGSFGTGSQDFRSSEPRQPVVTALSLDGELGAPGWVDADSLQLGE